MMATNTVSDIRSLGSGIAGMHDIDVESNTPADVYISHSKWHPKISPYRLWVIATTVGFGTAKSVSVRTGDASIPTTLEWIAGTVIFLMWDIVLILDFNLSLKWCFRVVSLVLAPMKVRISHLQGTFAGCLSQIAWMHSGFSSFGLHQSSGLCIRQKRGPICIILTVLYQDTHPWPITDCWWSWQ